MYRIPAFFSPWILPEYYYCVTNMKSFFFFFPWCCSCVRIYSYDIKSNWTWTIFQLNAFFFLTTNDLNYSPSKSMFSANLTFSIDHRKFNYTNLSLPQSHSMIQYVFLRKLSTTRFFFFFHTTLPPFPFVHSPTMLLIIMEIDFTMHDQNGHLNWWKRNQRRVKKRGLDKWDVKDFPFCWIHCGI